MVAFGIEFASPHAVHNQHHSSEKRKMNIVSRNFDAGDPYEDWPSYSQLPLHLFYPTGAAWGVRGSNDINGALNHITNATILVSANSEIRLSQAINLNPS